VLGACVVAAVLAWVVAATRERSSDPRAEARRLVRTGAIDPMTREEIVTRFGAPVQTNKWQGYTAWVLGPSSGIPIDHTWLIVKFDEHGAVAEARVVED
jgi:hypothetical protein